MKKTITISEELGREILEELTMTLEDCGGCDHSVGICACDLICVIMELRIVLGDLIPCPKCEGKGEVAEWSRADGWIPCVCPQCHGENYVEAPKCANCCGTRVHKEGQTCQKCFAKSVDNYEKGENIQ